MGPRLGSSPGAHFAALIVRWTSQWSSRTHRPTARGRQRMGTWLPSRRRRVRAAGVIEPARASTLVAAYCAGMFTVALPGGRFTRCARRGVAERTPAPRRCICRPSPGRRGPRRWLPRTPRPRSGSRRRTPTCCRWRETAATNSAASDVGLLSSPFTA